MHWKPHLLWILWIILVGTTDHVNYSGGNRLVVGYTTAIIALMHDIHCNYCSPHLSTIEAHQAVYEGLHCKEGIVITADSLLFQIQMSEHNSLPCGEELHDNLFLTLSQLSSTLHTILAISCVHASNWFTHLQQTQQMVKVTILFLLCRCLNQSSQNATPSKLWIIWTMTPRLVNIDRLHEP